MGGSLATERRLICAVDELEPGTSMTVAGTTPTIALHRTQAGDYFATADTCTHEQWSLGADGEIEGNQLVCPLHMARFDLATGEPLCLPATIALVTYNVVIEGDHVFIVS